MLEKIVKKFFDYEITGEYLEHIGGNRYRTKYIKKWYLKKQKGVQKCSH